MMTGTRGLSRNAIKWIAMITMLVDHLGEVFVQVDTPLYTIMRLVIGRIAFPLFAFLVVDGFDRSHHNWKQFRDYAILAVITEVFFDKTLNGQVPYWGLQNVMWTWTVCVLCLIGVRALCGYYENGTIDRVTTILMIVIVGCVGAVVCLYGRTDYLLAGPFCVVLCYAWKKKKPDISPVWLMVLICGIVGGFFMTPGCFLAIPIIMLYNTEKPSTYNKVVKYGFYGFYPIHLAILAGVRIWLGI